MRSTSIGALAWCATLALALPAAAQGAKLCGSVRYEGGGVVAEASVFAIRLQRRADGRVERPGKPKIFRAAADCGHAASASGVSDAHGAFELAVEPGHYALFAFEDRDGDGVWDPGAPEPIGWFAATPGGCFDPIEASDDDDGRRGVQVVLRAPTPFPAAPQVVEHGALRRVRGVPVLHLRGDAEQRGFAHGRLLATQIVDFFRFYVLEDKLRSVAAYADGFAPFLESHFAWPEAFRIECEAVVSGMRAAGVALAIPELGRDFSLTDLFAINSYIETRAMRSSCCRRSRTARPSTRSSPAPTRASSTRRWRRWRPSRGTRRTVRGCDSRSTRCSRRARRAAADSQETDRRIAR